MTERSGKEIWNEWMEELTPPFTVSYNPAGILYAKERIAELEKWKEADNKQIYGQRAKIDKLEAELEKERSRPEYSYEAQEKLAELREAGNKIISAIRSGLSQDELEAMEEFELLQEKGK